MRRTVKSANGDSIAVADVEIAEQLGPTTFFGSGRVLVDG
jgi:hypothetical protein